MAFQHYYYIYISILYISVCSMCVKYPEAVLFHCIIGTDFAAVIP